MALHAQPSASGCNRRSPMLWGSRRPKRAPRGSRRSRTAGHPGTRGRASNACSEMSASTAPKSLDSVARPRTARARFGAHGPDGRRTGVGTPGRDPVAYDFRAADMAAGGQGASLVPIYHRAVAAALDWRRAVTRHRRRRQRHLCRSERRFWPALGRSGDAFAYLAVCTLQPAPITFPGTTGV